MGDDWRAWALALAGLGAACVGLAQFGSLDAAAPNRLKALHVYPDRSVLSIAMSEAEIPVGRYGMDVALARIAPESRIVVVDPVRTSSEQLRPRILAIGSAASMRTVNTDPAVVLGSADPTPWIVASGASVAGSPAWAIALADSNAGPPRDLVLLLWPRPQGDVELLVERTLLRAGGLTE